MPGLAGLQAKLYPKFAYKTSNYEKVMYAIAHNVCLMARLFLFLMSFSLGVSSLSSKNYTRSEIVFKVN